MAVSNDLFKELMRRFAAGVTLVTFNENGKLGGLTVSSFCSLSMDPPLVLICIDREVASHESLEKTATFGVNICNRRLSFLAWNCKYLPQK
jgi:flavin reductase (DIM6/NTAB) family NADH-FMN oxidoreductase RutF